LESYFFGLGINDDAKQPDISRSICVSRASAEEIAISIWAPSSRRVTATGNMFGR